MGRENVKEIIFDYHYGMEAEQYAFFRIPKILMSDPLFRTLSLEAKVLYGMMMDRLVLSAKNGWRDGAGRIYIYFTIEDICESFNCGKDKAVKALKELEKDIGLIERKKQGQGKPTMIFVKNFTRVIEEDSSEEVPDYSKVEVKNVENQNPRLRKIRSLEYDKSKVKTTEKQTSSFLENRSQDFGKTEGNNTENRKTDYSKTNLSIHQFKNEMMDVIDGYRQQVKERISYDYLIQQHPYNTDLGEIVELIVEVLCTQEEFMKIGKKQIYTALVQDRMNQLDYTHIEYILECMKTSPSDIRNIKAYLLESLFNAPVTIGNYYSAKVNHDFYGSG